MASTNIMAQPNDITYLDPYKFHFQYQAEDSALLTDVGFERRYDKARIPSAIGIHKGRKLETFADTVDREIPIYIYCDRESRSLTVAKYLQYRGFREVVILRGYIKEWKAAGLPIEGRRKPKVFW